MSKKNINGLIIILSLIIVGILSYVFLFSNKIVKVNGVLLNKNYLKLVIGKSEQLEVSVLPENASDKTEARTLDR